MTKKQIIVGDSVKIAKMPKLDGMPKETVDLFRQCIGRRFSVAGISSYGHLEIEIRTELTGAFRNKNDTIWIEPDCVERL